MGIIGKHFLSTFTWEWCHHVPLPFLVIHDMSIIWKYFWRTFTWQWCHHVPSNKGILDNILGVGKLWDVKMQILSCAIFFGFNYSVILVGIMCPISPCSPEFSAFYEHFYRFLKFLTLTFQKVFPNYLGFAYVWHHDSCMTMIRWIFSILKHFLVFFTCSNKAKHCQRTFLGLTRNERLWKVAFLLFRIKAQHMAISHCTTNQRCRTLWHHLHEMVASNSAPFSPEWCWATSLTKSNSNWCRWESVGKGRPNGFIIVILLLHILVGSACCSRYRNANAMAQFHCQCSLCHSDYDEGVI